MFACLAGLWVGWVGVGVADFFDNDSDNMSVSFFVMDVALIDCPAGVPFGMFRG